MDQTPPQRGTSRPLVNQRREDGNLEERPFRASATGAPQKMTTTRSNTNLNESGLNMRQHSSAVNIPDLVVSEVKPNNRNPRARSVSQTRSTIPAEWHQGTVKTVKNGFGFIRSQRPLPAGFVGQDVYFKFQDGPDDQLKVGEQVQFRLIGRSQQKPGSNLVCRLQGESSDIKGASNNPFPRTQQAGNKLPTPRGQRATKDLYLGVICNIEKEKNFGYLKPKEVLPEGYPKGKDVHFQLDKVRSAGLPVSKGDEVEFSLGTQDMSKPKAFNMRVVRCFERTHEEMVEYMGDVKQQLNSSSHLNEQESERNELLVKLLLELTTLPAIWDCIGWSLEPTIKATFSCVELVLLVEQERKSLRCSLGIALDALSKTALFEPRKGGLEKLLRTINTDRKLFKSYSSKCQDFLLLVLSEAPNSARRIVSLMKDFITKDGESLEPFLLTSMQLLARRIGSDVSGMEWNELPLVPAVEELTSAGIENTVTAAPVREKGSYDSPHQYIDTYFRLLRTECFSALHEGIHNFLQGRLDNRDMNVYHSIKLAGLMFGKANDGLVIALQLDPLQEVRNWATTTKLMFGNLLCISLSGNFTDPIWATVANRDAKILKESGVIFVELCSGGNRFGDAEIVSMLAQASPNALIAESPTYYKAFEPVMKALQNFDPDELPFQEELVETTFLGSRPSYFVDSEVVDWSHVLKRPPTKVCFDELKHYPNESLYLDPFQMKAMTHSLGSRLSVIQGPPGTGKTYIGVKIIQSLLSMPSLPEVPVLVLTYKNHALDEFIKPVADIYPGDVLRIGGRSNDPALVPCSLQVVLKSTKRSKLLNELVFDKYTQLDAARQALVVAAKNLQMKRTFSIYNFKKYLNNLKIKNLLIGSHKTFMKGHTNFKKADIVSLFDAHDDDINHAQDKQPDIDLFQLLESAIEEWLPGFDAFAQLESSMPLSGLRMNKKKTDSDEDELFDETDVKKEEDERMPMVGDKSFDSKDMIVFKYTQSNGKLPCLLSCAKEVTRNAPMALIINEENLWKLPPRARALLVQHVLLQDSEVAHKEFESKLANYQNLCIEKAALDDQHKVQVMKGKKVVGMTITGAAMNHELIRQVKPAVIIVEEAAELLEPHVLAVLGPWVEHLILIGDHKQLKPSVKTHLLSRKYHFDVSMMERLMNNNIPHQTLAMQNRMRPEFAELLLDIYPNLQDNIERVSKHKKAECVRKSMFFWDHADTELGGRSYSNPAEANRVIKLALFLIQQGNAPETITIIAAYQGQVAEIRKLMRAAVTTYPKLFEDNAAPDTNVDQARRVAIFTIDMYQGDENDFVIVSLVRSSTEGSLKGFLNMLNRRCVAQSRARCGLYFVGNTRLLRTNSNWKIMITKMENQGCVSTHIPLVCPRHPSSMLDVQVASEITLATFCHEQCRDSMECGQHKCKNKCQPPHHHNQCKEPVSCILPRCGHARMRKCHQDVNRLDCKEKCQSKMVCGIHRCEKNCSPEHLHHYCSERVEFNFKVCGHRSDKHCSQSEESIRCDEEVSFNLEGCNHLAKKQCFQNDADIICKEKCTKNLSCGHICSMKCGEPCLTSKCRECKRLRELEALRKREEEKKLRAKAKELAEKEYEELKNKTTDEDGSIRTELSSNGDSAAEYFKVEDMVKKYIQPTHQWFPVVNKIQRVSNHTLEMKWLKRKCNLVDSRFSDLKFHGTSSEAIEHILTDGFKLPTKPGMYGKGIYFATDSSKSAQKMYTKGSNQLLLCDVLLGKAKTVVKHDQSMDAKKLKKSGYDSLFAKRDTRDTHGVLYDEFVVYDPDQAIVRYVIHYETVDPGDTLRIPDGKVSSSAFKSIKILPSRSLNLADENELHFRRAESQFLRLMTKTGNSYQVKSVELVINPPLIDKFRKKSEEMKKKYPLGSDGDPIFAFHGTKPEHIQSIVKNNFDLSRLSQNTGDKGYYGAGIYFSEFPSVSLQYGSKGSIVLCELLPGKPYDCPGLMMGSQLQAGYDSHRFGKDSEGRGRELVIFNSDQILPRYVVNFE